MILDFKEIPEANRGGGLQDTFELFARDFLTHLGYKIIEDPSRGADGKCDLIVEENVQGLSSEFVFRWLVSCKHYAHSGNTVKDAEEINILERLKQHKCDGFMGVYSTLCATSLAGLLNRLNEFGIKTFVYDHEKIEKKLLKSDVESLRICARYMPDSFEKYHMEHPGLANIFEKNLPIECDCCGRNLLVGDNDMSIYVYLQRQSFRKAVIEDMYFACKGECDAKLRNIYSRKGYDANRWDDLRDLTIPSIWIMRIISFISEVQRERNIKKPAFEKLKQMFIRAYPYVARNLTTKEKERSQCLIQQELLFNIEDPLPLFKR